MEESLKDGNSEVAQKAMEQILNDKTSDLTQSQKKALLDSYKVIPTKPKPIRTISTLARLTGARDSSASKCMGCAKGCENHKSSTLTKAQFMRES